MTQIRIIFEDESLCVVEKPAGLVVNDADSVKGETLQAWLAKRMGWPSPNDKAACKSEFELKQGLVHRLDKDTSGVMVLAKTEAGYEGLKSQFVERKTKKIYLALVHGLFKEEQGIISLPVERHSKNTSKFSVGKDLSRMAITEWKVVQKLKKGKTQESEAYSLMELVLHTGRTHQIRVHMAHFGHPLVADPIYGWQKKVKADYEWCPRLFLHARTLGFGHPVSGEQMEFEAELPEDLRTALGSLDKGE